MDDFDLMVGTERIWALVHCDQVLGWLACPNEEHVREAEFYLATLGWTTEAFVDESWEWVGRGH